MGYIKRRYLSFEYLGYCPIKGRLFSCLDALGRYSIVAKKGRNWTCLMIHTV